MIILICMAGAGISCSRTEPKIAFGFIEMVYYPGAEKPEERFSFFVIPEDDDGIENLGELYLHHDRDGLRWLIKSEEWVKVEEEGRTWIGSRNIAMSGDESLPRGQYRAVLINKGGEKTERNFTFDAPVDPRYPFPLLVIGEGKYRIDSQYPVNRLICYDQQGNVLQTVIVVNNSGNVSDLNVSANARSAALWAEDPEYRTSALTEAAAIR
ncbi:hypothetical protein [Leadbettera azotonutricia]|uniref:hypothetical protein n=1 Tax=Leadbettera azotonutricia TaxID=150829 RepID=UPI001FE0731D|nr:hypothetical protein [Leadbettera azotonutricia]